MCVKCKRRICRKRKRDVHHRYRMAKFTQFNVLHTNITATAKAKAAEKIKTEYNFLAVFCAGTMAIHECVPPSSPSLLPHCMCLCNASLSLLHANTTNAFSGRLLFHSAVISAGFLSLFSIHLGFVFFLFVL